MASCVARTFLQHVKPRTVGAHHRTPLNVQEHPRVAEGAIPAIARNRCVFDVDCLDRRRTGGGVHGALRVLYGGSRRYDSDATHAFNHGPLPGMRHRLLTALLAAALLLSSCATHL